MKNKHMTALSRKNDPMRRLKSFWRHFTLSIQALALSIGAVIAWSAVRNADIHFSREDDIFITCLFGGMFIAWSVMTGCLFNMVNEKHRKIVQSILMNEERTFMIYRDERMPIVMHMFLGATSISMLILAAGMDFNSYWTGVISISILTFCLSIFWLIIAQLDNPALSPWFMERIPKRWLTQSVDEHFGLKEQIEEVEETIEIEEKIYSESLDFKVTSQ
jgi:hypothetical protein